MKRFFVLAALLGLVLPLAVGCEKKAETKPAAAPEGAPATPEGAPAEPAK